MGVPPRRAPAIFAPMLVVVLTLLSTLVGPLADAPPEGWSPDDRGGAGVEHWMSEGDTSCCPTVAPADDSFDPCAPGDSCPSSGGCCSCVSCCKRVADAVPRVRPGGMSDGGLERALSQGSAGIDGGGAVWHPPRG